MAKHASDSVLSIASEAELLGKYDLARESGELLPPFYARSADGGLALIRKQGERFLLSFYVVDSGRANKVGEVTHLDELSDARTIAVEELRLPLSQARSFRWAKLKDDVVVQDGEAVSSSTDGADGARLPEGLLVKFVEAGSEPGKIVVEVHATSSESSRAARSAGRFEISKRLLNVL
ncbi:MAG: hypothetical protein QM778_20495 [Myxococcales bacterium]